MKRRFYVYFLLIFVLGIVIGAAGMYCFGWYTGQWHRRFSHHRVVDYLQKELSLSPSQTEQLQQIVNNMENKESQLRDQIEPQFQAIREETRAETRKILNAQQVKKFNEMVKRWDANRNRARHRTPPSSQK